MSVDAFIPLYGSDFFSAVDGYDNPLAAAYLRALWHYWHHTHCTGLPDDPEYLRNICRVDPAAWPHTHPVLFGEFFRKDPAGKWQQERAQREYRKALHIHARRVATAHKAAAARWAQPRACSTHAIHNHNHSHSHNHSHNQNQSHNHKQLNDEQISPPPPPQTSAPPARSSSYCLENELMGELRELLGEDEMARVGGHWRKNWVRKNPDLLQRALADMRTQIRERGPNFAECRGAWLTDLLKRWS